MGSSSFALPSLGALVGAGHQVAVVVTQPDRRAGRGQRLLPTPVKRLALENGLKVFSPSNVNDSASIAALRGYEPEVGVVAAFGQILADELLGLPCLGCVNVHASLLPKYRGAAPIQWAIIKGERETGVTIIRMTKRMDAGDILAQEATPISRNETAGELEARLAELGGKLLCAVLEGMAVGVVSYRVQEAGEVTYAPKLRRADALIDWNRSAEELFNFIRGLAPRPGAYTWLVSGGKEALRLGILGSQVLAGKGSDSPTGTVFKHPGGIGVNCQRGQLLLIEIQPAGGRRMAARDYVRGHPLRPGDRFSAQPLL